MSSRRSCHSIHRGTRADTPTSIAGDPLYKRIVAICSFTHSGLHIETASPLPTGNRQSHPLSSASSARSVYSHQSGLHRSNTSATKYGVAQITNRLFAVLRKLPLFEKLQNKWPALPPRPNTRLPLPASGNIKKLQTANRYSSLWQLPSCFLYLLTMH